MLDSRLCSEMTSDLNPSLKSPVSRYQRRLKAITLIPGFYRSFVSMVYLLNDGEGLLVRGGLATMIRGRMDRIAYNIIRIRYPFCKSD